MIYLAPIKGASSLSTKTSSTRGPLLSPSPVVSFDFFPSMLERFVMCLRRPDQLLSQLIFGRQALAGNEVTGVVALENAS